ncbi:hypothetical protein [Tychonema sp. LEGE 07203]|uniref:hypothetical protein n=1 Tax=Tychonema sp. LEGE 07203 TaxID=1828671 RepID=UPI0018814AF2|nr:hypothetical protein [Tychonema sp. LEGE 07203]MBE9094561.1 hypothetical protein [Tychonema sp. LEGE 07203]
MSNNVDRTFLVFLIVSYLGQAPIDPVSGRIFGCGGTASNHQPAAPEYKGTWLVTCFLRTIFKFQLKQGGG